MDKTTFFEIKQWDKQGTNSNGWDGKKIEIFFDTTGVRYECDLTSMGILTKEDNWYKVPKENCKSFIKCNTCT